MSYQDKPCQHETLKVSEIKKSINSINKPTDEELEKGMAVSMGLIGFGINSAIEFEMENPGIKPQGCFDMSKQLHKFGSDTIIKGVKLRCMELNMGGIKTGSFQLMQLLSYCKNNPKDIDCNEMDPELREQYFRQL